MKRENRTKWVHVRLTDAELLTLQESFKKTTERRLSSYARNILLAKPMIKGVRNKSAEDMMQHFVQLLKTLNGIANNYNQAVHKLHLLHQDAQYKSWLSCYEQDRRKLLSDIETMKDFMNQSVSVWLQ
ncbi:plasmid mobilization protein [Chitinophaga barathri]|uniref:Plasmid mobilization relaxosome protein MobC n=1 Tax=Chitinophaga barathri TaxID=1647451 RepID=A0A3N4MI39_9BACT|nr:plasmid mobilization relaxosome protein MobC [Chitinophaga barathri]RPD39309.1 plasmid mobilization relaxosome protein MobC [Chitinophaga barathri]